MSVDRDIVGRVGEDEVSVLAVHQHIEGLCIARISADESVPPELPEVSGAVYRRGGISERREALLEELGKLLDAFNLSHLAERPVETLAYGQQRLIEMALTLALKPKVLILEEPAAGVPASDSHLIIEAIERLPDDLAVLIIEHDMDLVFRVARRIIVLVAGAILVEGTPEEISRNSQVRELYLGGAHE